MMSVWVPGKTYISIVKNFCCFDDSLAITSVFVIAGSPDRLGKVLLTGGKVYPCGLNSGA